MLLGFGVTGLEQTIVFDDRIVPEAESPRGRSQPAATIAEAIDVVAHSHGRVDQQELVTPSASLAARMQMEHSYHRRRNREFENDVVSNLYQRSGHPWIGSNP